MLLEIRVHPQAITPTGFHEASCFPQGWLRQQGRNPPWRSAYSVWVRCGSFEIHFKIARFEVSPHAIRKFADFPVHRILFPNVTSLQLEPFIHLPKKLGL